MKKMILKRIINGHNKSAVVLLMTGLFITLYTLSGIFYVGKAGLFLLTPIDEAIPYLPWTSFLYIMMYPTLFWIFYELKHHESQNRLLYAFVFLSIISNIIFILYPVSFPREFYPIPFDNTLGVKILRIVRFIDKPVNCFPSLHVSSLFLFTYALWNESKAKFVVALLVTIAISFSTMATKQHYFTDVLGGILLATILYLFFWTAVEIEN